MKLQTTLALKPEEYSISYDSKVLLLGSCFSENIGSKFDYFKFQNLQNPFGIIFNPISIERLIERAVNSDFFDEGDVFEKDEVWHCLEVHSLVCGKTKAEYLEELNSKLKRFRSYIESSTHLILTYGTAWVYRYNATGKVVANCHKIPQKEFTKALLTTEEISASLKRILKLIRSVNDEVTVINTLSPVRHLKDGFVENFRSKAHLMASIQEVTAENINSFYFPSYEIMMDELRDYRYYSNDLLHPNELAIDIIWDRFNSVWIASETLEFQKEIASIQNGLAHRSFNENTSAHREFQKKLQLKIEAVQKRLPHVKF
ncbi:MAG: GSCFA domain-containing protein [Flavobacteriaceae bacterium]|nr:GSCFA domain-containing protein [Flavobacteriaceae bacterium]